MENASKALIIAGSIIVAIMIVAMGVRIFNGARNSADTTALDATEITMFNQKFERFAGESISGSNVKSLCSFAISNASTNKDEPSKLPTFSGLITAPGGVSAAGDNNKTYINNIGTGRASISATKNYKVSLTYGESGLITEISISE